MEELKLITFVMFVAACVIGVCSLFIGATWHKIGITMGIVVACSFSAIYVFTPLFEWWMNL